jgi:hypothetical protein
MMLTKLPYVLKVTRAVASLKDSEQFGLGADPREFPEPELFVVQQLAKGHGQTPRMRALSQNPFKQNTSDPLRYVAILWSGREQVKNVEHEEEGMGVRVSKLIDDRIDEMMLAWLVKMNVSGPGPFRFETAINLPSPSRLAISEVNNPTSGP